jgi:hypothetical protein
MGIPRLSQDLLPYATRRNLGNQPGSALIPTLAPVTKVIVDGPSLVYFVCNKLRARIGPGRTVPLHQPTYRDIALGVKYVLTDFEQHGISVVHIFFDGGLPHHKRAVRMDRLGKLRRQLEVTRHSYPGPFECCRQADTTGIAAWFWQTTPPPSNAAALPPPPFMVASVVEVLQSDDSQWKDRVSVVPGEADAWCASVARNVSMSTDVAILSNDSDMFVYALGAHGHAAILSTLEKHQDLSVGSCFSINIFNAQQTARKLGVPSVLRFSFERYMDSSATINTIKTRTTDGARVKMLQNEYDEFAEQYDLGQFTAESDLHGFRNLDPRTAEMVVELSHDPHVYLPPLLEDPQRDSSWSYGAKIRQLAYSYLSSQVSSAQNNTHVTEVLRRGQRVTSVEGAILDRNATLLRAAQLQDLLDSYTGTLVLPQPSSGALTKAFYGFATSWLQHERLALGKAPLSYDQVLILFGLPRSSRSVQSKILNVTWEDLHLLANLHAVLYSLRILNQILKYAVIAFRRPSAEDFDVSREMNALVQRLLAMPSIDAVFLDICQLRDQFRDASAEAVAATMFQLRSALQLPYDTNMATTEARDAPSRSIEGNSATRLSERPRKRKNKKRRGTMKASYQSNNSFALLMEGAT